MERSPKTFTGDLGGITFSTAGLTSGNLQMSATFDAGGSFIVTGNGTGGIPNGQIFSGTFTGLVSWTLVTLANGTHNYMLSGSPSGTWYNGSTVYGATVQLTINTEKASSTVRQKSPAATRTSLRFVNRAASLFWAPAWLVLPDYCAAN